MLAGTLLAGTVVGLAWYLILSELARQGWYLTGAGAIVGLAAGLAGVLIGFFAGDQRRRNGGVAAVLAGAVAVGVVVVAGALARDRLHIPTPDTEALMFFPPGAAAMVAFMTGLRSRRTASLNVGHSAFVVVVVLAVSLGATAWWRWDAPIRSASVTEVPGDIPGEPGAVPADWAIAHCHSERDELQGQADGANQGSLDLQGLNSMHGVYFELSMDPQQNIWVVTPRGQPPC